MANLLTCDGISPREDGLSFNLIGLGVSHGRHVSVLIELDGPELELLAAGEALSLLAEGFGATGPTRLLLHEWRAFNGDDTWAVVWWVTSAFPTGVWRMAALIGEQEVGSRPVDIGG